MNQWIKGILIASLALIMLGGILAAVGVMSGGQASLNALAAGGLLPVSAAETDSGIAFDNRYQVWTSDFEETLEGLPEDGTGRLEVEIGSVSLHVLESEEKTARIQGTGVRKAQAYVEDGTLYVRAESGKKQVKWLFGGGRRSTETEGEITLYLPEGFSAENASLNMGAGELVMDALRTDRLYCNVDDEPLKMYERICRVKAEIVRDMPISEYVEKKGLRVVKALAMVEKEDRRPLMDWLIPRLGEGFYVTCSADFLVEVMPAEQTKAAAVDFLCGYHGIPREKCAAIGDQLNDLPMIERAGGRFAVANADDALKDRARVVAAVEENGVAQALAIAMGEEL